MNKTVLSSAFLSVLTFNSLQPSSANDLAMADSYGQLWVETIYRRFDTDERIEVLEAHIDDINDLSEKNGYYKNLTYVTAMFIRSELARTYMEDLDEVKRGARLYNLALRKFRTDRERHEEIMRKSAATKSMWANIAFGALAAYGYKKSLDVSPEVAQETLDNIEQFYRLTDYAGFQIAPNLDRVPEQSNIENELDRDYTRFYMPPLLDNFRAIGRVSSGCTGTLISPRLVLTNSHCVTDDAGQALSPSKLSFTFERISINLRYNAVTYFNNNGELGGWKLKDWENDWAIIVLGEAVDSLVAQPLDVFKGFHPRIIPRTKGKLILGGYSGDLAEGKYLTVHWGCSIEQASSYGGIINDNCSHYKGSSGSPYFLKGFDKVIGVHAFGSDYATSSGSGTGNFTKGGGPTINKTMIKTISALEAKYK